MKRHPRISVVTCSLNHARFIEGTIQSVLAQDYPALEYIIIDGGSTDGTARIVERYQDRLAWWVSEPDGGQTDALIKGFARSTGEIMTWLCSDDMLTPGTLQAVGDYLCRHEEVDVVYGDAVWIDQDGRPLRYKKEIDFHRFVWLWSHNYLPQPSTFWRRRIYERVGGLDRTYRLAMDGELWERFSREGRIAHVPRVFSLIRRYPSQRNVRLRTLSDVEDRGYRLASLGRRPFLGEVACRRVLATAARVVLKMIRGCYRRRPPRDLSGFLSKLSGGSP